MNVQSDKRESILASALELIQQNGFHGTPMSLLAREAGVATGTIYHYFASKDELILALYIHIRDQIMAAMFNPAYDQYDFKTQFFKRWTSLCRFFISNPSALIFIEQYNSSPYAKVDGKYKASPFMEKFVDFFQSGMDSGILKPMAQGLIASVSHGCIVAASRFHISGRYDYSDEDICQIAGIIWDGIKIQD